MQSLIYTNLHNLKRAASREVKRMKMMMMWGSVSSDVGLTC